MTKINQSEVERVFYEAPFIQSLGLQLEHIGQGECDSSLTVQSQHLQQDGVVHAGVQATMADHTAGTAAASLLTTTQRVLSAEFKINLLRPAKGRVLHCHAKTLKAGSTLIVVESEIFCGDPGSEMSLVSKTTVTLAVVEYR